MSKITFFKEGVNSNSGSHQYKQGHTAKSLVSGHVSAVRQLKMQEEIYGSCRLTGQQKQAKYSQSFDQSIVQRKIDDGGTLYSGKSIYEKYKNRFAQCGYGKDEIVGYVESVDDITLQQLFIALEMQEEDLGVPDDDDPCEEEKKAEKEVKRTSAPVAKYKKLYSGSSLSCGEPKCHHVSRAIILNSDGTEKGYQNKHGRRQAPPVAHDKNSPANVRIAAFEEIVRSIQKGRFNAVKINSRYKFIRKKVEWSGKIGRHHQSHTSCNLRNKDVTWKKLTGTSKKNMINRVKAYLKRKKFDRELARM